MVIVLAFHAVSTYINYHHIMTGSILSSIAEGRCTKLKNTVMHYVEHTHLRCCEQIIKHKFPQCAPVNLETSCLLEIGDISRKSRLRCGCQFSWCALGLNKQETKHKLRVLTEEKFLDRGAGLEHTTRKITESSSSRDWNVKSLVQEGQHNC
jgi:hypothetical protein